MASMPPTSKMMGPPPGSTPQGLTSMVPQGGPQGPPAGPPGPPPGAPGPAQPQPPGGGGGLKDVFDELVTVLDSLAGIIPEHAVEIDSIKTQLAEVLAKAISGGAQFTGNTGSTEPVRSPQLPV